MTVWLLWTFHCFFFFYFAKSRFGQAVKLGSLVVHLPLHALYVTRQFEPHTLFVKDLEDLSCSLFGARLVPTLLAFVYNQTRPSCLTSFPKTLFLNPKNN